MRSDQFFDARTMMDPGLPQPHSGSFFLVNQSPNLTNDASVVGESKLASTTDNLLGNKSSSSKKRSKKKSSRSKSGGGDSLNDMPTVVGNDLDRLSQLMARCGTTTTMATGAGANHLFSGYANHQKGDNFADLMMMKGSRYDGSPLGDGWNRGGGGGMPHPMMMMPGQMSNYFTPPNLMMKTPTNGYMNSDYASLPPAINLNHLLAEQDELDGVGARGQSLTISDKHRFSSDPGGSDNENASSNGDRLARRAAAAAGGVGIDVGGVMRSTSGGSKKVSSSNQSNESTSSSSGTGASGSGSSSESQHRQRTTRSSRSGTGGGASMSDPNGRILGTLLEQINLLHETNSKICRNLHDTKVEIEALKHAPSWGLPRHRRDSISGLSTHSYASPAPASFHSGAYTPGMMTDVVREVREGARVREDAMLNRVKTLVDERTWQANELNYKLQREVEELKGQVHELKKDKQETSHRLSELELEIKTMRIVFGAQLQALQGGVVNGSANQLSMAQQLAVSLRNASLGQNNSEQLSQQMESTPLTNRQQRNQLNIKYGVLNEQESPLEVLPGGNNLGGGVEMEAHEVELMEKLLQRYKYRGGGAPGNNNQMNNLNGSNSITTNNNNAAADLPSDSDQVVMQMEKDTLDLRRELQDAVAGKKSAEQRILTLEREMQNMQSSLSRRSASNSDPVKVNNNFKSEAVANKFGGSSTVNGMEMKQLQQQQQRHQANAVQTLVAGTITTKAGSESAAHTQSSPQNQTKGSAGSFCLSGPVTDL